MLADILALVVGLSSLYLLSTAFTAIDRHRQDDFLWGAVGLFYALVLWLTAGRVTGALLLGQVAASALVLAFGWQTLQLRRALFYPDRPVLLFSAIDWLGSRLGRVVPLKPARTPAPKTPESPIETGTDTMPETVPPVTTTGEPANGEARETPIDDDFDEDFQEFEDDLEFEDDVTETWERGIAQDDDLTEPMLRSVPPLGQVELAPPAEPETVTSLTEITEIMAEKPSNLPENPSKVDMNPDPTENTPDQS